MVETPNGNLVAGMRWLLSAYTIRLNHRHKFFGHVFGGRYKALVAMRLRRETTLTIRQIAQRLHLGSWKSLNNKLYLLAKRKWKHNKV